MNVWVWQAILVDGIWEVHDDAPVKKKKHRQGKLVGLYTKKKFKIQKFHKKICIECEGKWQIYKKRIRIKIAKIKEDKWIEK